MSLVGGPTMVEMALNFFATIFRAIKDSLQNLLRETIFKSRPDLASFYSDGISLLISLTALFLILEFLSSAKKAIGIVLVAGWALLILAILISPGI